MKRQIRSVVAAVVGVAALAGASNAQESIDLHHGYKSGETATFTVDVTRTETTKVPAQSMELTRTIKHEGEFEMNVLEASATGTTIGLTLKKLKSSLQDPMRTLSFDSSAPRTAEDGENPLLASLRPIVGVTVTFKFDEKGRVVECTSDAELVRQSQFTAIARQLVGEESASYRWGAVFFPRPEKGEAKVGDVWPLTQTFAMPQLGTLKSKLNVELEKVASGVASMVGRGEFEVEPPKGDQPPVLKVEAYEQRANFGFERGKGTTKAEYREKMVISGNPNGLALSQEYETDFKITRKP